MPLHVALSTSLSALFKYGLNTARAGPSAWLPLFDFGRRSGNLQYAKASQQAAVATYEKTIQIAFREVADALAQRGKIGDQVRSEEHTSELQSLMRISYAVFCLKTNKKLSTT